MTSQFSDMTSSSNFFDVVLFFLSRLVTGPNFMSILPLVLELLQFSFIRDWPEIRKSEISPPEICPISGDWDKLGIPKLAPVSLNAAKCQDYSFYRFWVIKGKQTGRVKLSHSPPPPHNQIRVKILDIRCDGRINHCGPFKNRKECKEAKTTSRIGKIDKVFSQIRFFPKPANLLM